MYVRDFESYKYKRNLPLLIWIFYQYMVFSLILAIIFTVITPLKSMNINSQEERNTYYFILNNLFFINFELNSGDLIAINPDKVGIEKLFLSKFINVIFLNLIKNTSQYDIYQIIGVPYDIISIKEGILYINGKKTLQNVSTYLNRDQTFYLSSDQYFCISLSKDSLDDSLFGGIIEKDYIAGKIIKDFKLSIKNE